MLNQNTFCQLNADYQNPFTKLKDILIAKPSHKIYYPKLPLHVCVDACAVLKQLEENNFLHPLAFYFRAFRSYRQNYFIAKLECLAIDDTLDKLYLYLRGWKFCIYTDHAHLVWLNNFKLLRGRLFWMSVKLGIFDYYIKYERYFTNVEVNMMSRNPILNLPDLLVYF